MILVIDTSSRDVATIGTIDGQHASETFAGRGPVALTNSIRRYVRSGRLTKVAVATGPGSFTGLRVGVSVALGVAMGLKIPIVPLPSLGLQAARSDDPVTAVADAGRGRYYYLVPGGRAAVGEPADIPTTYPLVGRVANREAPLLAAGHTFKPEKELRWLVTAALNLLESAVEVPYRNLEIEYMQSFSPRML
jgi:tRNA threonylcarbamoyl adenosine modification protein YeaZ